MHLNQFEQAFYPNVLTVGHAYQKNGRVQRLTKLENPGGADIWQAFVYDTTGPIFMVSVELSPTGQVLKQHCKCPYGGLCAHVAGMLFILREHLGATLAPDPNEGTAGALSLRRMLSRYNSMPQTEQRVLKVAALMWEPSSGAKLHEIFQRCGFKHENRELLAHEFGPILAKFVLEGLLSMAGNSVACPIPFANALCDRYFSKDTDFLQTVSSIVKVMPLQASWHGQVDLNRCFRDMRLGRYADDKDLFKHAFQSIVQSPLSQYDTAKLADYWLGTPFDLEKFQSYGRRIQAFLITQRFSVDINGLRAIQPELLQHAADYLGRYDEKDRPALAQQLAFLGLLRGDWALVEKAVKRLDAADRRGYSAIKILLEGNAAAALTIFERALKAIRSQPGTAKEVFYGIPGLFYLLAIYKAQDPKLYKKIHAYVKKASSSEHLFTSAFQHVGAVTHFLENNKAQAVQALKQQPNSELGNFFHFLAQFWVDSSLVKVQSLYDFRNKMEAHGYTWMVEELNALIGEMGHVTQGLALPAGPPLARLLPRIEEWENALRALLEMGGNAAASTENRITWLVDFENGWAQARHQTVGKRGWTKGRTVSIERLRKNEVLGATAQDQRFINDVGYAWGGEIKLLGNDVRKWKSLVDHPLLFLKRSPSTAVQLVESKPVLVAKRIKDGYQLHFTQNVSGTVAQVIKESPTRYLFVEANDQVLQIARAFNGRELIIPAQGEAQLREVLAGLAHLVQVQSAFGDENLPNVRAAALCCVHLLPVGNGFHVEIYIKPFRTVPPYVKPGEGEPFLIGSLAGERIATTRDLQLEADNLQKLCEQVPVLKNNRPTGGTWQLDDTETCLHLLLQLHPLLEADEILLEWPKGEKFRIDKVAGFDRFRMTVTDGVGHYFEVKGEMQVDEDYVLTLQDLLVMCEQQRQFVEIGPGRFLALTEEFRRRLQGIDGLLASANKDGDLQLHPLAAPALEGFLKHLQHFGASQKFQESKQRLEQAFAKTYELSPNFNAQLRPYQLEGFQWLHRCAAWGVGACLADDMGLGKTIQALAFLIDRAERGPALVVAPASVCRNWMNEVARFAPTLHPILFSESDRQSTIQQAKAGDLVIVTYDLMTREEALFTEKKWATVILDEAQAIKNRMTRRSDTAMALQADFKMAMTGTPIENHLGELWNLFHFLNPGLLGSIEHFATRFSGPIERLGDDNRRGQLRRLVQPFILRRRKEEVLKDLPEKTEITLTVQLSPGERAFYEALRRNALDKLAETAEDGQAGQQHFRILAEIVRLRRAACHPSLADKNTGLTHGAKLELFAEIVEELLDNGHKALVFSQFVDHLHILENHLKEQKISYQYLDGSTPGHKRQQAIDAFQAGVGDIFLISLKAGGTGLNLTAADYVIHTDPWWNPAVEDQATDRVHRIGQERPVTVYRLVAEHTIEEKILQLHAQKRDLADSLLMGADVSAKLTAEDLMKLLQDGM